MVASCAFAQATPSNPSKYLTAWYKCVGDVAATGTLPTTTTTVYDSSGFGNNGTYAGTKAGTSASTYYSAGMVGPYGCYFDGSSNSLELGGTSAFNFGTGSFTYSFWMTPKTVPSSSYVVPLQFSTTGNASNVFCHIGFDDGLDNIGCAVADTNSVSSGSLATTYGTIAAGQTYMVTMTADRTANVVSLYINGVLNTTASVTYTGSVNTSPATATNCLGANQCSFNRFNGTINDLRLYSTALTNWQVAQLYFADLAQNTTPQVPGQIASLSVSGTSAYVVPADFMGWSIEWNDIATVMGQASTGTDLIIRQLATNLTNVSGGNLYIRIGGNSTDNTSTAYTFQPEVEFLAANPSTEFSAGVCAKTCTLTQQEAEAAAYVGAMASVLIEFGNEPDDYGITGTTYLTDLTNFLSPVHTSLPSTVFAAPSCGQYNCTAMAITANNALASGLTYNMKQSTTHAYPGGASGACASPYDCLLKPATYQVSQSYTIAPQATYAHGDSAKFRINELNSLSSGGQSGVSNAFGSALWAIAASMAWAQQGIDGVNFHGGYLTGDAVYYDAFQVTQTAGTPNTFAVGEINPLYYAMLFVDTATQNNAAIYPVTATLNARCSVSGWTGCLQAWETKDTGGVYRLSLVNLDQVNSGNVVVSNAASTASVCYLSAPSFTSQTGVTFAGQTFDGSTTGTIKGTASYTTLVPSGGVFTIPMAVTQAAIVRFGASTGC